MSGPQNTVTSSPSLQWRVCTQQILVLVILLLCMNVPDQKTGRDPEPRPGGGLLPCVAELKGRELRFGTAFIVLLRSARKGLEVTSPLFDSRSHQSQNVSSDTPVGCWGCFTDSCSFASHLITCIHWTLTRETISFTFFPFSFLFSYIHPNHSLPSPQIHPLASLQKRTGLSGYQPNMA